ncbi:TPA: hypothetical protein QCY76_003887 [Bacillus cereus]|uniref:hypothetical protein n=1 Tax=Bacillus TaxID=1386 RepID=UPI001F40883E|nr:MULTISPECIES: hypothetical protein [Bacillus]MCT1383711.1 hypothetical protein [Bacillus sp. p3-SID196]BCD08898.1 hypothetical protein BC30052_p2180 [Bacillus cereus]HDR8087738.1 hypothetical protein [Bacillus cereus]HDX9523518.1 hypothetical protein [Bacillus cereus]HDX9583655.1 hypothetical protein [Bacillus cereus]
MNHNYLISEWTEKDSEYIFGVVGNFCVRNQLHGSDGLPGLLNFVKKLYREKTYMQEPALVKSFGEIAYSLWALDKLGHISFADAVAQNFKKGGDFGDTCRGGNYFRNFELQLEIGLRFIEAGFSVREGGNGEPDYIIESNQFVVEVKAPASKIALIQDVIKAVKQIEASGKKGVIVLVLDHMVARGMIQESMEELPELIKEQILSVLPTGEDFNTIGVIVEWVKWDETSKHPSTITPIMNNQMYSKPENIEIIKTVWQSLCIEDITTFSIHFSDARVQFDYSINRLSDLDPSEAGKEFYERLWGQI